MSGDYEIWLTNDHGVRVAQLDDILWFDATRVVNGIGSFRGGFKANFDTDLVKPDFMVQLWRAPMGGRPALWRVYFVRKWRLKTSGGEDSLTISEAPDVNDLLRRRIVAAYAGSTQADKTDFADDMMKEIVTESMADGVAPVPAAGTRAWADLSVAAALGAGPALTKAFAFRKLLEPSGAGVLPDVAEAAKEAGTEVFFDVAPNVVTSTSINFQFRTYTGQPGMDVSGRVVFDQQRGNLENPFLEYDFTQEENYVYGGGQGEAEARNVQQAYDATRYGASQWNRCEGFRDARDQESDDGVREAARTRLWEGRPRRRFGGRPLDTKGTRFGRDWDFGYKVKARYRGLEFDSIVRAVTISMNERAEETVQARLEYED